MFSKACEYAIKSAIYIAEQSISEHRVNVKEVSKAINAPEAFTAKILQQLCRENLLESLRGKTGGFIFSKEKLHQIKIYDIIAVIDGVGIFTNCGLGLKECSSTNPCPVHDDFKVIRDGIYNMARKFSLYDLALKTEQGIFRLKS